MMAARNYTDAERLNVLLRLEALVGKVKLKSMGVYEKDMINLLNRMIAEYVKTEGMTDLQRRKAIDKIIKDALGDTYKTLQPNIIEDMKEMASLYSEVVNVLYDTPIDKVYHFNERTLIYGYELGDVIDSNEVDNIKTFKRIIAEALREGKHPRTVGRELKRSVDKASTHVRDVWIQGAMDEARWAAMLDSYKYLEEQGYVTSFQWVATLEVNTCIKEGEAVNLSDGTSKQIEKIESGDEIITHLGNIAKVKAKADMGNKEVLEVVFDDGRVIRGTPDHKIWTGEEWLELGDIEGIMV